MRRIRAAFRRLATVILPWPARNERKAAIHAARREKEHSQASAQHAAGIEVQIRRMAQENHFAARITDQIIATYRGKGG